MRWRTAITSLVQGIIVGGVLAVATAYLLVNAEIKAMHTTNNGWTTTLKYGAFGNDILLRAASAKGALAANVAEEAVYWNGDRGWRGSHAEWAARLQAALPAWRGPA